MCSADSRLQNAWRSQDLRVRVADRLAFRAGQHGDVAKLTAAVKANNGILIALVMAEDPNLLASSSDLNWAISFSRDCA